MLVDGRGEGVGGHVGAEVDDREVGALEHHAHEVLADVVEVALDGAKDGYLVGLVAGADEQRFQQRHPALHGAGADEHLGNEDLLAAEAITNHAHGVGHHAKDIAGRDAFVEGRLSDVDRRLAVTGLHGRLQSLQVCHRCSSGVALWGVGALATL